MPKTIAPTDQIEPSPARAAARLPPLLIIVTSFAAMAWLSWRKWPDLLVDFGLQLYIPWQLSEGSVLYRDIAHLPGGPFSQYFNALLFKTFGISFSVLIAANLVITGGLIALIYAGFRRTMDILAATATALAVILVFAFAQYLDVGNYSYIAPYSHESLHGLVISIAQLVLISRWLRDSRRSAIIGAGICFGTVFLTKPEIFLATAAATGVALWFARTRSSKVVDACLFLGSSLATPLLFFLYFCRQSSVTFGLHSIVAAWEPLFTSNVGSNAFYKSWMGFDAPMLHITRMFAGFVVFGGFLGLCAWRLRKGASSIDRIVCCIAAAAVALLPNITNHSEALPLILVAFSILLIRAKRRDVSSDVDFRFAQLWLVFSLLLLAKMGIYPRLIHYGFVLAMPALVAIVALSLQIPRLLQRDQIDPRLFRTVIMMFWVLVFVRCAGQSFLVFHEKDFSVGHNGDRIVATNPRIDARTAAMADAIHWIESHTSSTNTLAVLPEGAMLNYITRRKNPTPYLVFMAEVPAFGEQKMSTAYKKTPPDFIVLFHRDSSEYGYGLFGSQKGYGMEMMNWISKTYKPVHLIGKEPLQNTGEFGIKILQRNN